MKCSIWLCRLTLRPAITQVLILHIKQHKVSFGPRRFLRFVRAHEKGGPTDEAAVLEVQLTE